MRHTFSPPATFKSTSRYRGRLSLATFGLVCHLSTRATPPPPFQVVLKLPFDHVRKCMTVVLRNPQGDLYALCKGADTSVAARLADTCVRSARSPAAPLAGPYRRWMGRWVGGEGEKGFCWGRWPLGRFFCVFFCLFGKICDFYGFLLSFFPWRCLFVRLLPENYSFWPRLFFETNFFCAFPWWLVTQVNFF